MILLIWIVVAAHAAAQATWLRCAYFLERQPIEVPPSEAFGRLLRLLGASIVADPSCNAAATVVGRTYDLMLATSIALLLLGTVLALRTPDAALAVERNRLQNGGGSPIVAALYLCIAWPFICLFIPFAVRLVPVATLDGAEALFFAAGGLVLLLGAPLLMLRCSAGVPYALHLLRHGRPPDPLPDPP